MRALANSRGNTVLYIVVGLLAVFVLGGLLLHFGQKRHDELSFDIDTAYPPDHALVGGEAYASTASAIMRHELSGVTGWRPNDFFLWGPNIAADNNASRQLGIIQALRETVRIMKDHLTKVSSTEYDANLVAADRLLRNDETKFWLPSAESRYKEAVNSLDQYVAGLKATPPTSKPLNRRNIELIRLFQTWSDLLGDAHANLFKEHEADGSAIMPWHSDDYFYHAQGMAHVMHHMLRAVKREYAIDLVNRPMIAQMFDEMIDALGRAAVLKPVIVLDWGPESPFANHRRNLDVYIVDARQKMYTVREELEK
ncbi:MAG: DUF2333 family protein [Deltaproteobacteria bacterium]|nr:DUF2333 family protein [Deltaproteobacteria bacterium]